MAMTILSTPDSLETYICYAQTMMSYDVIHFGVCSVSLTQQNEMTVATYQ